MILDPLPPGSFRTRLFGYVDYVTPNETELMAIAPWCGRHGTRMRLLRGKGVGAVIAKCGADGAYLLSVGGVPARPGLQGEARGHHRSGRTHSMRDLPTAWPREWGFTTLRCLETRLRRFR